MSRPRSERPTASRAVSYLAVMLAVSVALGVVVAGLAVPFAGVAGLVTRSTAEAMDELPQELEDVPLAQRTTVLDKDGNVIASLYDENRVNVELSEVKRIMVKAIVSIEDYRFYEHGALDVRGTIRALVTNQASGSVQQGGSSITQQLVKLTLLNAADSRAEEKAAVDDTYARKLRELRYAVALEQQHSKDWILERYLNSAYFGDGAYGIQAAAVHYFNVNASALSLRQSAMLAGLVKSPDAYDPTNYLDRAIERRNVVLDRMAQLDVIPRKKAERVKKMDVGLDVQSNQKGCVNSPAQWFCDYAVAYLAADPALGDTVTDREELITSGGLTIKTTLDLSDQQAADASVRDHVYPDDEAIGGLAMVEPRTGAVRALSQSKVMGREPNQTFLNYVVPEELGDSAGFQAGSTFKAFVLAQAIKQGIPLNTKIPSPQTKIFDQASFANCPDAPPFAGTFPISNSTGEGTFDLYSGTQNSVNTFFMQLEQRTGVCAPFQLAKDMGLQLTNPTGDSQGNGAERVPTFTLGVPNVSPVEMAEAYATFAGRGLHCDARPITSIEDAEGNTLKTYDPHCQQVMEAPVADAVNDILRGVQEPGGFGYDAGISLDQPSAGKTGTTSSTKSVWFVGYTPTMAAASMIAGVNTAGQPQELIGHRVQGQILYDASGSGTAGPMWGDAMKAISGSLPDEDFVAPDATTIAGVTTPVPDVYGQSVDAATSTLEAAGFEVSVGGSDYSDYSYGTVAYTSPGAATELSTGSTVVIYTSAGAAPAPPPPSSPPPPGGNGGGNPGNGGGNSGGNSGNNGGGNGR